MKSTFVLVWHGLVVFADLAELVHLSLAVLRFHLELANSKTRHVDLLICETLQASFLIRPSPRPHRTGWKSENRPECPWRRRSLHTMWSLVTCNIMKVPASGERGSMLSMSDSRGDEVLLPSFLRPICKHITTLDVLLLKHSMNWLITSHECTRCVGTFHKHSSRKY